MFTHASPRAIALVTPYLDLGSEPLSDAQDLIPKWAAAISMAPHTEEVVEGVVDTLLQIAANPHLRPSIPAEVWLWLNKRPSLPPVCRRRRLGDDRDIVRTVRGLNDIGILTSYLIMIWSEWEPLNSDGFAEMRTSVREDFNGIGMGCHRAELIQRLDYVLGELNRWPEHHHDSPVMKDQYGQLKKMLQELDREATEILNRMLHNFISLGPLTLMDLHRIPLYLHVCPASPVSIASRLGTLGIILG
jgi:hypothetical protein